MYKSGIYRIQSKLKPARVYIGSAVNLVSRMNRHINDLKTGKHFNAKLQRHSAKHGIDDLQFSVLQVVPRADLIEMEQFYFILAKPWFNICKTAGSRAGTKHTTKAKLSISRKMKSKPRPQPETILLRLTKR